MNYLAQVQRGIDYVETHLEDDLRTKDVARHAGISHWHFQRLFRALTSETLKGYIRGRRFARALEKLSGTNERVLDIALGAGFETQESFTRAFKDAFGVPPAQYRKSPHLVPIVPKVRIDRDYLLHVHRDIAREPVIVNQKALTCLGMRTQFFGPESEKNNMAAKLPVLWDAFLPRMIEVPMVGNTAYGIVEQTRSDELNYWAAVPIQGARTAARGFSRVDVPKARYAQFTHRGSVDTLDRTVSYIYSAWLIQSGFRHTYGPDLEMYGPEYVPNSPESVMHYAIPVAKAKP